MKNGQPYLADGTPVNARKEDLPGGNMPFINTGTDRSSQNFALKYMLNRWINKLTRNGNDNRISGGRRSQHSYTINGNRGYDDMDDFENQRPVLPY